MITFRSAIENFFILIRIDRESLSLFKTLYRRLLVHRKIELFSLTIGAVISGILEVLGIVSLYMLLRVLIDISAYSETHWLIQLFAVLGIDNRSLLIPIFGALILVIFVMKNIFILFYYNYQSELLKKWKKEISFDLMKKYLYADYTLLLGYNSATIIRNINSITSTVVNGFLLSFLSYAANVITGIFIALVLFIKFFMITVGISLILTISTVIQNHFLKRKFKELGEEREKLAERQNRDVNQGFHAIKETRVLGCEGHFLNIFETSSNAAIENESKIVFYSRISSHITEIVIIFGVLAVCVAILSNQNVAIGETVASLGVLAGIAFRLAPTMNRSISAMQGMHKSISSVKLFIGELEKLERAQVSSLSGSTVSPMKFAQSIEVNDVGVKYPRYKSNILNNISTNINFGEIIGIVGKSGAGKTTFIETLIGLLNPVSGSIEVDGVALNPENVRSWQKFIGYVPQSVFLSDDTILSNIAFGVPEKQYDAQRARDLLDMLGLGNLSLDYIVGENGKNLSGGQRQRLGIARALYFGAKLLVFDEATSALDVNTESDISKLIKSLRGKVTVIIVAHRLSTIFDADKIILFDGGRILAEGTFSDLCSSSALFKEMADKAKISANGILS